MKIIFKTILCLPIFCLLICNVLQAQTWTQIGAKTWPTNPNGITAPNHFWQPNGMGNIGNGQVTSIWVDPADSNHLLIGLYAGGIYETFNAISGGTNVVWTPKTDNIPIQTVNKIAKKNGKIFAASGVIFWFSGYNYSNTKQDTYLNGLGVVNSTDGGNTWNIPVMPDAQRGFFCMDFTEPTTSGIMYAVDRTRAYKSLDSGNTWTYAGNPFSGPTDFILSKIVCNPNNPNIVYVSGGAGSKNKVYRSTDGGNTWTGIDSSISNTSIISSVVTMDASNNLFISVYNSGGVKILKSTDWTNFTTLYNNLPSASFNLKIKGSDFYLAGMEMLNKITSPNTVSNLTRLSNGNFKMHVDSRDLNFGSYQGTNYLFCGNDGGINLSDDDGLTWRNITGNIVAHIINSLGYYSDPFDRVYDIGTQDDGWYRNEMTEPLDQSQTFVTSSYEGDVYTSPHNKRFYFKEYYYSDDNGITPINSGFLQRSMAEDPLDHMIRYHNGYNTQPSNAPNFFKVTQNSVTNIFPMEGAPTFPTQNIGLTPKIALNSNNNILYPMVYFDGPNGGLHSLFFSNDGGLSWENVGKNIHLSEPSLPDVINTKLHTISWVTMDDYNPNRMWISFSSANLINQKVYESNDYGKTWQNISLNLSNVSSLGLPVNTPSNFPVNVIDYDENRDMLYIGTDYGVFYLDKTVTPNQWKVFGTGLPRSIVTNLFVDDYYNDMVVGLAGKGIWHAPLTNCKDELIMTDTTWNGITKTICGDLRVKHDVTLNITSGNIVARNVILEPGAKIIWSGGILSSSDITRKSFVICGRDSKFTVKNNVTINNYIVNNFETGTVETGSITLNNSTINNYKNSFYDFTAGTKVTMSNNSNLNFHSDYYFKTHNSTVNPSNGAFLSPIEGVSTNGYVNNGKIRVFDNVIKIQNETLRFNKIAPGNTGSYLFQANDHIVAGNNVDTNIVQGDFNTFGSNTNVDLIARNYIELREGTYLANTQTLVKINSSLPEVIVKPYNKTTPVPKDPTYNPYPKKIKSDNPDMQVVEKKSTITKQDYTETLKLYPNPVISDLNYQIIDRSLIGKEFKIMNLNGALLQRGKFNNEKGVIDVSRINETVFLFVWEVNGNPVSQKIFKRSLTDKGYEED